MLKDISLSAITAGFVAILVGFTASAVIVFAAAQAAGAGTAEISSWFGALGLGMGVTCIGLSLYYKMPIVTAWSTPGAALLITSLSGVPMSEAIGAFVLCGVLILLCGISGWFERIMDKIPQSIATGMLAGVLLRFGMDVFVSMQTEFLLAFVMFCAYLLFKRWSPRYAIVGVLLLGIGLAWQRDLLRFENFELAVAVPVFTAPVFSWSTLVGVGIPLFFVTMTSQNIPGIAVIRGCGFNPPISPLISWTGFTTLLLAPFGGFTFNLAAITAAICMGEEAHPDPSKRYMAAVFAGVFSLLIGIFGATVAALFIAFPKELVLTIAGLALFSTIASSLAAAMGDERNREPALITFLVTASGASLFGIGAAFWGLVGGVMAMAIFARTKTRTKT